MVGGEQILASAKHHTRHPFRGPEETLGSEELTCTTNVAVRAIYDIKPLEFRICHRMVAMSV